jgi:cysteine-rich repeat protein
MRDYCTVQCIPRACPPGYHCAMIYGAIGSACVQDAPVCGNHVVERSETCDDGNTTPGDGCDDRCLVETPRPGAVSADVSIAGSELAPDGGTTPRVAVLHVGSRLDVSPACGLATLNGDGGVIGDGGVFQPIALWTCPTFGTADTFATLAWVPGTYDVDSPSGSYTLGVCANLRFDDAPGCVQRYCAATGATPSSATWDVVPTDGGVHGMLAAHLVPSGPPVADPDAGCSPVYGPTLDVNATVDRIP